MVRAVYHEGLTARGDRGDSLCDRQTQALAYYARGLARVAVARAIDGWAGMGGDRQPTRMLFSVAKSNLLFGLRSTG